MKKHNFKDLDKKILIQVLEESKRGEVTFETFEKAFPLIEDENNEVLQFESADAVSDFLNSQNIHPENHYKYIFTGIDDEGVYLLNGWHLCNRLFYVISTTSWSTGNNKKDESFYIETKY